ncbi:MAG: dUTP diphosphatase [Bacillota bacterium]|nr:dUTP diphosphatase [Bacillota bacterium]
MKIAVRLLEHGRGLPLPSYASAQAAGLDIAAACTEDILLPPLAHTLVPAGFCLELPPGYEAQIRPRSGLAARQGVTVLNSPGTIDADYRGEVKVLLINLGAEDFVISRGMRIAQMVIAPVIRAELLEAEALAETERGDGGFGHTGI